MAPSPTIRRLLKETAELSCPSSNPNPAFFAAPVSDADLHEWHFTLLGPPSPSPYAGGMYHGRISLPPTYPLKPPNFRFLTPSGRFEVNREICLSISGFHEETWMPAWGVRTALTALRSFMAEKGSAGQVGGLEAPADIRKRLAKESRSWKCEACGKTNETIMREWWDICKSAGVDLKGEEDLGLESLPEGMLLETRDPTAQRTTQGGSERQVRPQETVRQPQQQPDTASNPAAATISSPPPPPPPPPPPYPQTAPRTTPQTRSSSSLQLPSQPPFQHIPTPSAEAAQASAEAVLTPGDLAQPPNASAGSATHGRPLFSGLHNAPLAAANAAIAQNAQPLTLRRDRDREQTITIDRAIAGVFLALCLMVLKKIFFPAGSGGVANSVDDFYLQRE
ncbi:ubiquitin-conjugating enzyme E2 J1 [Cladophialophora yegresii CBS 114405]|uniref:Ubiquitin-conjugating enzyme E2 J1 n=1 Tax=Cladophialophora yegresii CBS 114405 TaxID=1182544 RepID=W9VSX2_9EURO|nr:ubiquitin-conjugating enzyme E2 J1 [Cladophialophora yegresii CBS 114405]EXJ56120.1 ubiquitin-conjugating enzyme E2 J1 [Cladophialophora yegresii CBS 114405]